MPAREFSMPIIEEYSPPDDIMGFESKADAQEMLLALKVRLASFGLMLHEGMTRVTLGKSRVREIRLPGSVRAKPNG
jgi:hypothetical protein